MRRVLVLAALMVAGLTTPAYAQDDSNAACMAQMASVVRPILQQASQFSPQGMGAQGFVPLAAPFAPPLYASPVGLPPAPPGLAPPTAQYNLSANFTGLAGLPQPGQLNSQQLLNLAVASGRINPASPQASNMELMVALANLQQTEQARQQQQALLGQQQGLYLNSLYQLSSSYQVTSLDWSEAYSSLAQAWMSYFRDVCRSGGDPMAALGGLGLGTPASAPTSTSGMNQAMPSYPAGNAPMVPGGAPGYPGLPPMMAPR
jgi:hypothetical protein